MVEETFYPATTLPAPLSVVWGRFPYVERPGLPGVDYHPCLVLDWAQHRENRFNVLVVFGTSKRTVDPAYNFRVSKYIAMKAAGLNKETFFDLGRFARLEWSNKWFNSPDLNRWPTPVIGRIVEEGAHVLRYQLQQRVALGLPVPPRPAKPPVLLSAAPPPDQAC